MRGATLLLFNTQVRKSDRISDPAKFWWMPWDAEPADEEQEIRRLTHLTQEERDSEARKFIERLHKQQP